MWQSIGLFYYAAERVVISLDKEKIHYTKTEYFLIPFTALFLLFLTVAHFSSQKAISGNMKIITNHTLRISESYAKKIEYSEKAVDRIIKLFEEKLRVAGRAVEKLADKFDGMELSTLARDNYVDEINIFDWSGEIVNSTTEGMLGQKAPPGHFLYDFISSDYDKHFEDIRVEENTSTPYKYAYFKKNEESVVQIGIFNQKLESLLGEFNMDNIIKGLTEIENVVNIFFTDNEYNLIASANEEFAGISFSQEDIHRHFLNEKAKAGIQVLNGLDTLHVCVPVFHDEERIGTLTVVWPPELILDEVKGIIKAHILRFILVVLVLGITMFYAYGKNKSNVRMAYYDRLTGFPNDVYLKEYLNRKINSPDGQKKAVMLLNLENFNLINNTYGYEYGDYIIKQAAKCYGAVLRARDRLFRLAADRFVMVINGYAKPKDLKDISDRMIKEFKSPGFDMRKHGYLSLKVSICELDKQNITVDQILHNLSLGTAFLQGDPTRECIIYNQKMRDTLNREGMIERQIIDITEGKSKDSFHMVYQPLKDMKSDKIIGFEALARLQVKGLGQVAPMEFITLAEKRHLIFPLGNIIFQKINEFMVQLKREGNYGIKIFINISGLQLLREEFINQVKENIAFTKSDWEHLVLEITESTLFERFGAANKKLKDIKDLGGTVALDDFGTGYSSFAELRNLNIDLLKIDSRFIRGISSFGEDSLITEAIIAMAHKLKLDVVAEGVENKKQMDYLKKHGCDIYQGFYLSKPMVSTEALEFLKTHG